MQFLTFWGIPTHPICDSLLCMDADREAIPNDIVALKEALAVERANALEITAELAIARAKASEDAALIAQQKLRITKLERQRDVPMETIDRYLHGLFRVRPDFVYSVSRDFAKSCQTPMLVLPDDVTAHPLQVSIDIASLAPNAEITVFPWKDPPELKARTINRARTFLKRHLPA